jgi:hypothetical protein
MQIFLIVFHGVYKGQIFMCLKNRKEGACIVICLQLSQLGKESKIRYLGVASSMSQLAPAKSQRSIFPIRSMHACTSTTLV